MKATQLTAVRAGNAPEVKVEDAVVFEHKEYDVTGTCDKFCSCCTASSTLLLEPNEVMLITKNCWVSISI